MTTLQLVIILFTSQEEQKLNSVKQGDSNCRYFKQNLKPNNKGLGKPVKHSVKHQCLRNV